MLSAADLSEGRDLSTTGTSTYDAVLRTMTAWRDQVIADGGIQPLPSRLSSSVAVAGRAPARRADEATSWSEDTTTRGRPGGSARTSSPISSSAIWPGGLNRTRTPRGV